MSSRHPPDKGSGKDAGNAPDSSFNTDSVDIKRRRMLVAGTTVVGGLGVVALATPMLASMSPSERAKAAGAPVEADISKLAPGQLLIVEWRGKPVWIVKRTPEAMASLAKVEGELRDPASDASAQPEYTHNAMRSFEEREVLVMLGVCTHLGCSPTFRPDIAPADLGPKWQGGFFCPCHGSKFDFAGRVYQGVPAPLNLEIPPHRYVSDAVIVIGEDPEGAAA